IVRILNSETLPPVIVMHAFSGSPEIMPQMPENIFYSFSPAILDVNHKRMRTSAAKCPENRILIESDDMPASVLPNVAAAVAEIRGVDVQTMAQILLNNSQGVFINGHV
ncbi:MAG: TatD family hydrolase, partial [Alphaproteobacteria bacterium]